MHDRVPVEQVQDRSETDRFARARYGTDLADGNMVMSEPFLTAWLR
jgi:hypothetical protein